MATGKTDVKDRNKNKTKRNGITNTKLLSTGDDDDDVKFEIKLPKTTTLIFNKKNKTKKSKPIRFSRRIST